METLNSGLINKLSGLLFFLKRSKTDFEMVADEIENYSLKNALNGLSEESNFYASELNDYLKYLGISATSSTYDVSEYTGAYDNVLEQSSSKGYELTNICTYNEMNLTDAYSDLLKENMPFESLKEIILYQLNALKYSFMKIKTLNIARFTLY